MSTNDSKLNFRLSPSNKTATKTYDNLNANGGSRTINSANAMTDDDSGDVRQTNGKNVNEFPFGDISFRFDELQNCHGNQTAINSGNSARMDSDDFNYKMVRSNGNHRNIEYGNMGNGNGTGLHHQHRTNKDVYTTSANQMPAAIAAMNNAIAQLSPPPQPTAANHEYENVGGVDDTDQSAYRSMAGKPVHSDAKSMFLGLKNNSANKSIVCVESPPRQLSDDINENVTSADVEEFEPLLDTALESNRITCAPTRTPATTNQYQNVPSNSVCFVTNAAKSRGIECSECGKQCCDEVSSNASKWESDRDQHCRCNGINSSPTSTSGGTMSSAGIDSPTCSTSMKSAKPITLDNSTSFRMSQSLSQVNFNSIFCFYCDCFSITFRRTRTHYLIFDMRFNCIRGYFHIQIVDLKFSCNNVCARTQTLDDLRSCSYSFVFRVDSQLIARLVQNETKQIILHLN